MSLRPSFKTRGFLAVTVSAICLVGIAGKAEAKTRTIKAPPVEQQAPVSDPLAYPNAPLRAGALTLDDVLEAHRNRTKSAKPPPAETQTPSATATAPVLSPPSGSSTTGLMVSQGMKAVLQKLGPAAPQTPPPAAAPTLPALKVPVLQPPAAPAPAALASGAKYQPGQEPRNLATGKPSLSPVDSHVSLTAPPSPSAKEKSVLTLPCKPRVEKWQKSCEEAGYPASFVGKILGETRIDCKTDNQLHDFWVSNTCAPRGSADEESAEKPVASTAPPPPEPEEEIIEGVCGKADGESFAAAPTRELCESGTASEVEGTGPWTWSCAGSRKALTERCAASVEKETEEERVPVPVAERTPQPVPADEPEPDPQPAPPPPSPRVEPSAPKRAGRAPLPSADDDIVMSPELVAELTGGVTIAEDSLPASQRQASSSARAGGKTASASMPEGHAETPKSSPPRPERKPEPTPLKSESKPAPAEAKAEAEAEAKAAPQAESKPEPAPEPKAEAPAPSAPSHAPVNEELCGAASEILAGEAPTKNLCRAGAASPVNGDGPWTWSCTNNEGVVSTCRTLSLKKPAASAPSRPTPESAMVKAAPRVKVEEAKPLKPLHEPAKDKPESEKDASPAKTEKPAVAKTEHFLPTEPPPAKKEEPAPPPRAPEKSAEPAPAPKESAPKSETPPAAKGAAAKHFLPEKPPEAAKAPSASKTRLSLDPALSSIAFAKGTDAIGKDALTKLSKLAVTLKDNPDVRISLISHADSAGSSPREAHRLSLNRALNVRGYLSSHGVNESRMDVSAKGSDGAEGNKDSVDIEVYD